jgi:hypothetical protein
MSGPAPNKRQFLLISPLKNPVTVWVDDDGTCAPPTCKGGPYHLYEDEFGRKWAFRCPASIDKAEQERIFWDDPPGSGRTEVLAYRARLSEAAKRRPTTRAREFAPEDD